MLKSLIDHHIEIPTVLEVFWLQVTENSAPTSWHDKWNLLAPITVKFSYMVVLEKAMAPHSSSLAWKIPWTEEPGRLQSMGSLRVRHDRATSLSLFTSMHWRRQWQPTPVFLPGESQGRDSLVGCRLWGRTESDTTEATWQQQQQYCCILLGFDWEFLSLS